MAAASRPRGRIWWFWVGGAMLWLAVTIAVFGGAYDRGLLSTVAGGSNSLLRTGDCVAISEPEGAQSCLGIARMSSVRVANERRDQTTREIAAGGIILGPPVLAMILIWLALRLDRVSGSPAPSRKPPSSAPRPPGAPRPVVQQKRPQLR